MIMPDNASCPCGSGYPLGQCCGPLLTGIVPAVTAEALMRSRYTAYCIRDDAYVLRTWHPSTRPSDLATDDQPQWCGLMIVRTVAGGPDDGRGLVEFVATGMVGTSACAFREASRFVKENGQWLYVDGEAVETTSPQKSCGRTVGRNQLCPCGSGKKFKKCCGR